MDRQRLVNESIIRASQLVQKNVVNEIVRTTSPEHREYERAVQDPSRWAYWSGTNPHDSISIWLEWKRDGKDLSQMSEYFRPDLTPCGSFPNALGYAIYLQLKRFWFQDGDGKHQYSTTPVRNSGGSDFAPPVHTYAPSSPSSNSDDGGQSSTATTTQQTQTSDDEANRLIDRMNAAVEEKDFEKLSNIYSDAKRNNNLSASQERKLDMAYKNGVKAIKHRNTADARHAIGHDVSASASTRRSERNNARMNKRLNDLDLDEVKELVRKSLKEEILKKKNQL